MNISLTPELDNIVKQKVKSGMYNSASEVIREALRLFQSHDELQQEKINALRLEVKKGIASLNAGKGIEMTDDLFENIKKRGKKRIAELKD